MAILLPARAAASPLGRTARAPTELDAPDTRLSGFWKATQAAVQQSFCGRLGCARARNVRPWLIPAGTVMRPGRSARAPRDSGSGHPNPRSRMTISPSLSGEPPASGGSGQPSFAGSAPPTSAAVSLPAPGVPLSVRKKRNPLTPLGLVGSSTTPPTVALLPETVRQTTRPLTSTPSQSCREKLPAASWPRAAPMASIVKRTGNSGRPSRNHEPAARTESGRRTHVPAPAELFCGVASRVADRAFTSATITPRWVACAATSTLAPEWGANTPTEQVRGTRAGLSQERPVDDTDSTSAAVFMLSRTFFARRRPVLATLNE